MTVKDLQTALGVKPDGVFGPISRAALMAKFINLSASAVTQADIAGFASRLGCTVKQIAAVATVESSGGGFDKAGRPKILFERHLFHRQTGGKWSQASYSDPIAGGYGDDSWNKLGLACAKDPDAAFGSCSWGKFQVLGLHWSKLGYASPYALALSTVAGEASHYELLARYIEKFGLIDALRALSRDPDDCRAFARAYNGTGYETYKYHTKLAAAMA
ncbi:N-acetylmuramidase domain-containing protein [Novosphingobium resinovorum]|uniref:N-acetylmuramidase domain-containing protein n=1 Tax=Novosphingobium resinovorum TaxID=158500 RepID=UPI002ED3CFC0|nr:N-acetylmuramidase domain-containing protein [Novosphingobium resinovorum]